MSSSVKSQQNLKNWPWQKKLALTIKNDIPSSMTAWTTSLGWCTIAVGGSTGATLIKGAAEGWAGRADPGTLGGNGGAGAGEGGGGVEGGAGDGVLGGGPGGGLGPPKLSSLDTHSPTSTPASPHTITKLRHAARMMSSLGTLGRSS